MSINAASAITGEPIAAVAVGEVAADILDRNIADIEILFFFVTEEYSPMLIDISAALSESLAPRTIVGVVSQAVIGGGSELEKGISVLAVGGIGRTIAVHLDVEEFTEKTAAIVGLPSGLDWMPFGAVLLADPITFPVESLLKRTNQSGGFPRVVGGSIKPDETGSKPRMVINGEAYSTGAALALLETSSFSGLTNQGTKNISPPFTITDCQGSLIREIAGENPGVLLASVLSNLNDADSVLSMESGVLLGIVTDPNKQAYEPSDFLSRPLVMEPGDQGFFRTTDSLVPGDVVAFQLFDSKHASEDLALKLNRSFGDVSGALLFGCQSRARVFSGSNEDDLDLIVETLDGPTFAGMRTSAQFGVSNGSNQIQGFSYCFGGFGDDSNLIDS